MINQLAAWGQEEFMIRTQSFLPKLHNGSPSNRKKGKKQTKKKT
jgi:hypothetical protein